MKKFFIFLLCLILLALAFSWVWKMTHDTPGAKLLDIPASTATTEDENTDETDVDSDRTEETDRAEIQNNLRDARELIESGATEDATMIIKSLKTRDLTESERAELEELQKMMIVISD